MLRKDKHALIESALFGRTWTRSEDVERYGWLLNGKHPGGSEWDVTHEPPNYSADLNLCAIAEAKIAERGEDAMAMYHDFLGVTCPPPVPEWWWRMGAPASARVNAIVAVIREMEAGR